MDAHDLVDVGEMYLKAVLELEEEGVVPMRARLAERFAQSTPTVSDTVERLDRAGLLTVASDRTLTLTPNGRETALGIMRKHRVAEVFLDRVIGLDWELIHEEACRWEHVMSDRATALMEQLLGAPTQTPYGNPIAAAPVRPLNLVRAAARDGRWVGEIAWIGEALQADPRALAKLRAHGVLPGAHGSFAMHGPSVIAAVDGHEEAELPHELAAHVFVRDEAGI